MKHIILLTTFLALIINMQGRAQFKDWDSKFGIRYNQIYPENEFKNLGFGGNDDFSFESYHFSFLAEILYAIELSDALEVEFNLGYGKYAGEAYCNDLDQGIYNTTILPFDVRLKVNPFQLKSWNPFFYVGAGVMHYLSHTKPEGLDCEFDKTNGWAGLFPIGIGSEFSLGKNLLLELSLGGTLSTSFELDGFKGRTEEIWDSYFNTSVGLIYNNKNCNTDEDNDLLSECDEKVIGTDPNNPDSDSDGILDGEEFNNLKTNPLSIDTDGDRISDYDEVYNWGTNPLNIDSDLDGLDEYKEIVELKSNPLNADTDGDGINDFDEVTKYATDLLKPDTDVDGLSDSEEIFAYKTNPLKKDSDDGSIDDLSEIKRGTNPLEKMDDIPEVKKQLFVFENITFGFDKTNITKESEKILNSALSVLNDNQEVLIEISGHTDNKGTKKYNQLLSERRAKSVKDWLVKKGIDPERLTSIGFGMDKPIVPNTSKANRQKNRRCELKQTN